MPRKTKSQPSKQPKNNPERDPRRGSRRAYPITREEVALFEATEPGERHSIAWKLYHVARINAAGGSRGSKS